MSVIGTNLVGKRAEIIGGNRTILIGECGHIAAVYVQDNCLGDGLRLAIIIPSAGKPGKTEILPGLDPQDVLLTAR